MFNILIFVVVTPIVCTYLCACTSENCTKQIKQNTLNRYEHYVQDDCRLVDISFDGETHQYVLYRTGRYDDASGSLSHWEGCKYCKEKQTTNKYIY